MTKEDILQQCTVDGNIVRLPEGQLDRKLYQEVAKSLTLIGGKWKGGKVMGFIFQQDPTDLLEQIANGDKRNLKKEFQFFATPDEVADLMISKLMDVQPTDDILEPSAGQGALVDAFLRAYPDHDPNHITLVELMPINCSMLKKKGYEPIEDDFLTLPSYKKYKFIVANPPFSKNQDIDHIRKMYELLQPGGMLVTLCSPHYVRASMKKEQAFASWLSNIDANISRLPSGTFKEAGTMIETLMLQITR